MQEIASTRFSVSYHLKDLLKRDPQKVAEIAKWLETHAEKPRDKSRRTGSRRMMARLIAAKQLLRGLEDTASAETVMVRTEGKVADRVISDVRKSVNIRIELASQPHELPDNQVTHHLQATEPALLTGHALDQQSSEIEPAQAHPTPPGEQSGSIRGGEGGE